MRTLILSNTMNKMFFSTSVPRFQLPLHPLWKKIQWGRVQSGDFAVVNPFDSHSILYLSETEYLNLVRVVLSRDRKLFILADPFSSPEDSSSSSSSSSKPSGTSNPPTGQIKRSVQLFSTKVLSGLGVKMRDLLIPLEERNFQQIILNWGRTLNKWLARNPNLPHFNSDLIRFTKYYLDAMKNRSALHAVRKMKITLFCIDSFIAGQPLKSTEALGAKVYLINGLPRHIPSRIRGEIRANNLTSIRLYTSICNSYKAFCTSVPKPDFSTIGADPFVGDLLVWKDFCFEFWDFLLLRYSQCFSKPAPRINLRVDSFPPFSKAGPNHRLATYGAALDAFAWALAPKNHLKTWIEITDNLLVGQVLESTMSLHEAYSVSNGEPNILYQHSVGNFAPQGMGPFGALLDPRSLDAVIPSQGLPVLGKLALKEEAAGKVRIFAIVDFWTQLLFRPLHLWIFEVLKCLPSDATFDQDGTLRRFINQGYTSYFCYDLKSATDLIPIQLSQHLLSPIVGSAVSAAWVDLMVDRDFKLPGKHVYKGSDSIRYTRGQPMGALSSWAMLALTHHALVLFSAARIGLPLSYAVLLYLVLGDDIVIAHEGLAREYVKVCEEFGIVIGLAKSFISHVGFVNFANQSYLLGDSVSPASLREEVSCTTPESRLEFARRLLDRGFGGAPSKGNLNRLVRLLCLDTDKPCDNLRLLSYRPGKWSMDMLDTILLVLSPVLNTRTNSIGSLTHPIETLISTLLRKSRSLGGKIVLPHDLWRDPAAVRILEYMESVANRQLSRIHSDSHKARQNFFVECGISPFSPLGPVLSHMVDLDGDSDIVVDYLLPELKKRFLDFTPYNQDVLAEWEEEQHMRGMDALMYMPVSYPKFGVTVESSSSYSDMTLDELNEELGRRQDRLLDLLLKVVEARRPPNVLRLDRLALEIQMKDSSKKSSWYVQQNRYFSALSRFTASEFTRMGCGSLLEHVQDQYHLVVD